MARTRKVAPAAKVMSKREHLQQLMDELNADQEHAIKAAQAYFSSPEMAGHLSTMEKLRESALPDQIFDTLMKNNITVVTSTADWLTQWVNRPQPEEVEPQPQP